ncbi:GNAT family N-acetyltransferase [Streptacidiphilus sp. ASG 303]|uniref:GNAT family N-acetyltransferase n=1 Tax=Streptacidiphilus sp. ASG 303 TaxID=2896847 RepID=UPI001E59E55E|nr:GNAT family N-acetyltransferase [Streptacidiphilus sp. ASG 303]MCD0482024.1 GNAT family N-acetyltransferase [Streptacidiphilus sp. ASG 303]
MGETVVVRQAGPADVAAAADLWYASHQVRRGGRALPEERHELAQGRMADPGCLLLIAEDLGVPYRPAPQDPAAAGPPPIVGSILGEPAREDDGAGGPVPGLLHIALVSVHPDQWGRHVGRLLVEAMLARAAVRGYRQAQLWAHADSTRANRLYRAVGFRRTGRARIDDWGELVVQYRRDLAPRPPG